MSKHIILFDKTKQGLLEKIENKETEYFNKPDKKLLIVQISCDHDGYRAHLKVVDSYENDS
jgi:hypothetical protein